MKKCSGCGDTKDLSCFFKDKGKKNGVSGWCKLCTKVYKQSDLYKESKRMSNGTYYAKNKEKILLRNKTWKRENQELVKIKNREYEQNKVKIDVIFKLKKRLRNRLYHAIKNNFKSGSAIQSLDCSIEELKKHLESKFQEGMSWNNYGYRGWHIDHIIPLDSFDLADRDQLLKACHYTNLQPLWAKDNILKGNKVHKIL